MAQYFYIDADGKRHGPIIGFSVMAALAKRGTIRPDTIIESESSGMFFAKDAGALVFRDGTHSHFNPAVLNPDYDPYPPGFRPAALAKTPQAVPSSLSNMTTRIKESLFGASRFTLAVK